MLLQQVTGPGRMAHMLYAGTDEAAEVHVTGVYLCSFARAIFPCVALSSWLDYCLPLIIVVENINGIISWLSMFLFAIHNRALRTPSPKLGEGTFLFWWGEGCFLKNTTLKWCEDWSRSGHKKGVPRSRNSTLGRASWYWCIWSLSISTPWRG